ncbi:hypothetical protein [Alsobacter sp. SYSU BS001988]
MRTLHSSKQPLNTIRLHRKPPLGWGEAHMRILLGGLFLIMLGLALGGLT